MRTVRGSLDWRWALVERAWRVPAANDVRALQDRLGPRDASSLVERFSNCRGNPLIGWALAGCIWRGLEQRLVAWNSTCDAQARIVRRLPRGRRKCRGGNDREDHCGGEF